MCEWEQITAGLARSTREWREGPSVDHSCSTYTRPRWQKNSTHTEEGVKYGAFADDFQLWMKFKNEQQYTQEERSEKLRTLQRALDSVDRWSKNWGIPLSKTKSGEAVLFWSNNERQNTDKLELYLGGEKLKFVKETKLLGVTIDDRLLFNTHLAELRAKIKRRMKAIAATTGKTWGGRTATIRTAYMSHVRSAISHGAPVWYPLISNRKKEQVERIQNSAARMITGCWTRANTTDVLLEANLPPLAVHFETSIMRAIERARHRAPTESLTQIALSIQPAVKDRVVCAD